MLYFLISLDRNEQVTIAVLDKEEVVDELKRLGMENVITKLSSAFVGKKYLLTESWGKKFMLVKGEIVTPQEKKVITETIEL